MLSNLSRGTTVDKIRWIFNLYDIDGNGSITKQELLAIVKSIYNLLGNLTKPLVDGTTPYDHVEKIFYVS
jgi:calsenilin, presenilin binding protein, EF hand transcription factor